MIYHISKLKDKKHTVISIDTEKVFNKIQQPFMIKTPQRVGIEGPYINIMPYMTNTQQTLFSTLKN